MNDFRVSELARGRMGAPLAGSFEAGLMRHPTMLRVSQNLGGMGNVTVIPPSSHPLAPGYMAFDTGPGNVLIDASVRILTNGKRQYDKDGVMGKAGAREIDELYVEGFIKSVKYLARSPPKTTGRELFSDDMARRVVDDLRGLGMTGEGIIANVTRITAETVVRALRDFIEPEYGEMEEIYMCGGGAENPNITEFVAKSFPRAKVAKLNEATNPTKNGVNGHSNGMEGVKTRSGIPADAKEAVMFALLGFLCVSGRAVPIASGEKFKEQGVMGKITPGENYGELMRRVMAEEQGGALKRILMK